MAAHDDRASLMVELLGRPALAHAAQDLLRPVLASLLVGRFLNQGVLTDTLALPETDFQNLWAEHFPGEWLSLHSGTGQAPLELQDLRNLLLQYRAAESAAEVWLAQIVAFACCGRDHLWQDLGLANRSELSVLMTVAFPALAALNVGDMKWKKFLYRHYCSTESIYVCPAPSCGECADHAKCFAPEQ
ncbi:nitrogen fixation protein NifQ [Rhodoferax antarcticus]|uniref:NifQ family protein n=1 Tax=Rhodoferax antarcticus ANT.BR TaxID=1111071 RepID=A0A1Q8YFW9_9BURK|nr:nitrogen fixation protein NifQ [Rhodoferax antarcticus]MCW2312679.1 nitrogen fixation protein NifQ [Rhodoferax antarcticus]OLP06897.1 nifQ family protein [Rhodoferax antarcticus ANT.BR]